MGDRIELEWSTPQKIDTLVPFDIQNDDWGLGGAISLLCFHAGGIAVNDLENGNDAAKEVYKIRKENGLRTEGIDTYLVSMAGRKYPRYVDDALGGVELGAPDVITLLTWKYGNALTQIYNGTGSTWNNPQERAKRFGEGFIALKDANEGGENHPTVDDEDIPPEVFAIPEIEGWCRDIPTFTTPTYLSR